jgi:hypothetical protein
VGSLAAEMTIRVPGPSPEARHPELASGNESKPRNNKQKFYGFFRDFSHRFFPLGSCYLPREVLEFFCWISPLGHDCSVATDTEGLGRIQIMQWRRSNAVSTS